MSDETVLPVYDEGNFTHIASVEEKTLAALERIEVLLTAQLEGLRFLAKLLRHDDVVVEGEASDVIKDVAPTKTPFIEKVAKVAPRRGR